MVTYRHRSKFLYKHCSCILRLSGVLGTFYQTENSVYGLLFYGLILDNQVLSKFELLRHNNNKNNCNYSNKIILCLLDRASAC